MHDEPGIKIPTAYLLHCGMLFFMVQERSACRKMQLTDAQMRLYAITDDRWLNGRTLYDCVEDALKGGVTMLQIREKHCST